MANLMLKFVTCPKDTNYL